MKILWICGSRIVGGAERVTLQLAELWRQRGHVVEALCPPHGDLPQAVARQHLPGHFAPLGGWANVHAARAIARALNELTADVAVVTTVDEWVWSCLMRPAKSPPHLVLVRHMSLPLAWPVRWLARRRADAVVAVSQAVRASLLGRPGVRAEQVHVIYNPVRFPPRAAVPTDDERARAREALSLGAPGRWVGFFGGTSRRKGIEDALAAVRRANETMGCTNLMICGRKGSGRDAGSIADAVRAHHLDGRVHYLGEIDRMPEALTAVDVVVMPTRRVLQEALPLTLIEAMACGTPVLGYATGGIPEVIGPDGQSGRLARPDDAIDLGRVLVEILADPVAARQLAGNGLVRVRALFDPQHAADQYEQVFLGLR